MAWVERLVTRTSQPQDAVGVDWSNPLTRGLEFAYLPGHRRDSAGKLPGVPLLGVNTTSFGASIVQPGTDSNNGLVIKSGQLLGPLQNSTVIGIASTSATININDQGTAGQIGTNGNAIYCERGAVDGNDIYKLGASGVTSQNAEFTYRNDAGTLLQSRMYGTLNDGKSHLFGAVKRGTQHIAYLDKSSTSGTFGSGSTAFTNASNQMIIGSDAGDSLASWNGKIDLVSGWSRALSDAEVKSLSDNPWQIFEPEVQRIWVGDGVSAGGPGDAFGSASDLTLAATAAIGAGAASASAGAVGLVLSQASAGATGNAQASSPLADLALSAAMATATGDAQSTGLLPNLGLSPAAATATGGATASATASVADLLTSPASASATGQAQTSGSVAGLAASAISGTAFNTALGTALGSPANVALSGVAGLAQGAASTATSVAGIALAAATGAASNTADAQAEAAFAALLINPTTGAAYGASHAVGSLPLVALAAASGTASSATVTKGRPASDTSNTGWAASTGVDLYAMLDEEVPSAIDYISASSVGAVCEMALNSTTYPGSAAQRLRYRASSSTGHSVIVRLKQGAIVIRSETQALTDTDTEYSIALTPGEIAAITSGALSVQLESAA